MHKDINRVKEKVKFRNRDRYYTTKVASQTREGNRTVNKCFWNNEIHISYFRQG